MSASAKSAKPNNSVAYSRMGDAFHYRWAARRCLRLLYPTSRLQHIVIEGSDPEKGQTEGELVLDVVEYWRSSKHGELDVVNCQLKHTHQGENTPFLLSGLKKTLVGFAKRYQEHIGTNQQNSGLGNVTFAIVTNRLIDADVKDRIQRIARGETIFTVQKPRKKHNFQETLEAYTGLQGKALRDFCACLRFQDSEGNYEVQETQLRRDLSQILADPVDNQRVANLVELVWKRVLSIDTKKIEKEDVLNQIGGFSERDLFPAPPAFEQLDTPIIREQQATLLATIQDATNPVLIHAAGGTGKSIVAQQLAQGLPSESLGLVYDCFGGGKYRKISEPRHRYKDALVQIANELMRQGLCSPLLSLNEMPDRLIQKFLACLTEAIGRLRAANAAAQLVIFIDAADNAAMEASDKNTDCFVHGLVRETYPEGCKLVILCRPERRDLLRLPSSMTQIALEPFSEAETATHLRGKFQGTSDDDVYEFHRLTSGNPRVQAYVLARSFEDVGQMLAGLTEAGTTVEAQIEAQLAAAIVNVQEMMPNSFHWSVEAICTGLASLPPFIPIEILARAANVKPPAVRSLAADLGHSFWLTEQAIQFRDEPTETWFREKFIANQTQISEYVQLLEPLATESSYVAEVLPGLLYQAGEYDRLVRLALDDVHLPHNSPIDERQIRVYRLRFAFKAALSQKRYADAIKLAIRAGEELSSGSRQRTLLRDNVDLIAALQDDLRVQELAFRQTLSGGWDRSENVYSAALLSSVEAFHGEARNYLRSADKWLWLELERSKRRDKVEINDIAMLLFAWINLLGSQEAVAFLRQFRRWAQLRVTLVVVKRFVDAARFEAIELLVWHGRQMQGVVIAAAHELLKIGRFLSPQSLLPTLYLLSAKRKRIPRPSNNYDNPISIAIISFVEACAVQGLPTPLILRVLNHYAPACTDAYIGGSHHDQDRAVYLRSLALRMVLRDQTTYQFDNLLRPKWLEEKLSNHEQETVAQFKRIVGGLLPWYLLRARLLLGRTTDVDNAIEAAGKQSQEARKDVWRERDYFPFALSAIKVCVLIAAQELNVEQVRAFVDANLGSNQLVGIGDRIELTRAAFRLEHLKAARHQTEQLAQEVVDREVTTESAIRGGLYIDLARAVMVGDRADAAAYFDDALNAVSRFGDELPARWESIASIAAHIPDGVEISAELAYRFMRCAELIGDEVHDEDRFDRYGAVATCARLAPASAFAILSRWRDRDVGDFPRQFPALANTLARSGKISPQAAWSLSAFFPESDVTKLAVACIERATSVAEKQRILQAATRDMRLADAPAARWQTLKQAVADEPRIDTGEIDRLLAFYATLPTKPTDSVSYRPAQREAEEPIDWDAIFDQLDLTMENGVTEARQRFQQLDAPYYLRDEFWSELYKRLPSTGIVQFLEALVWSDAVGYYQMFDAVKAMPTHLREKRSVKRGGWDNFLRLFARQYAASLARPDGFAYPIEKFDLNDAQLKLMREGVFEGLAARGEQADSSTFFGFADVGAQCVEPEEAMELLDFAIGRFELYIEPERADGHWDTWLNPPDLTESLAGFVWSALGSPFAAVRWQAAHCVRRLAEGGCSAEIDALMNWLARDEVGCFGCNKYPFYNLHARLYLFVALARVTLDDPSIVQKHAHIFVQHALEGIEHILIEMFSAEIALNIENKFPNTYDVSTISRLQQIASSPFPVQETESYRQVQVDTPWHSDGIVDLDLEFRFGMDIDGYWFEPLGRTFGVSTAQIEELAREFIIKDWGTKSDGTFYSDPRVKLWESHRHQKYVGGRTQSQPLIDNHNFYLSYHSMFAVASKLRKALPTISSSFRDGHPWQEWLSDYILTRTDGKWLADRRDPAPLRKPDWYYHSGKKGWRQQINDSDYIDTLLQQEDDLLQIVVAGQWEMSDSKHEESYRITSALVAPEVSQALLTALTTCPNPHDFKLPDYEELQMEFQHPPFQLSGWIWRPYTSHGLDEHDPFAAEITYPPYYIGESVMQQMNLILDEEHQYWSIEGASNLGQLNEKERGLIKGV